MQQKCGKVDISRKPELIPPGQAFVIRDKWGPNNMKLGSVKAMAFLVFSV